MDFNKDKDEPQESIKYSLAFYLWLILFQKETQILKDFDRALDNKEIYKIIQARVNEILRHYEAQLLAEKVIENIKKDLQKILKEKKWVKVALICTQVFGLFLCGILLKDILNLPKKYLPTSFIVAAIVFIVTTIVSIILALLKR